MPDTLSVHTDGGSRGNPGRGAIGIIIFDSNREILCQHNECIGMATNNEAEYRALIKGLQLAAKHTRKEVQVFMDSELVVNQMCGKYRIKKGHLLALYQHVKDSERLFTKVTYNWVPRENRDHVLADQLVNKALDS
jgi:ribonuclease HI